jgi:hypothetical protein
VGEDPFGEALDRAIEGKTVGGRALHVWRFPRPEDVRPCAILFLGRKAEGSLPRVLSRVGAHSVLTVGEGRDFVRSGGIIRFFVEEKRVRFEVNLKAAEAAGLRFSSRLLGVAAVRGGRAGSAP